MRDLALLSFVVPASFLIGCGSSGTSPTPPKDSGVDATRITDAGDAGDTGVDAGPPCDGGSCIQHLVVIVQENHTFDNHFGGYCTATPGSNPTCNDGPACCEAMPATDPSGTAPTVLTDAAHAAYDPTHTEACEVTEIDNGKMDGYV